MRQLRPINFNALDAVFLFTGILCFIFLSFYFNFVSDDAFITFRYVRNFIHGLGPVYNAGEYVEGFTSPLWFFLLSGLAKLGIDIVAAGRFAGLFFGCLQIVLLYLLLLKFRVSLLARFCALMFLSFSNIVAIWSLGGLEFLLYSFLLLVNFAFLTVTENWSNKKLFLFSLLFSITFITRIEGAFVIFVALGLFSYLWWHRKIKFAHVFFFYLLPSVFMISISFIIRYFTFHEFLPNTFYVKVGSSWSFYMRGIEYVIDFLWHYGYVILFSPLVVFGLVSKSRLMKIAVIFIGAIFIESIVVGGDALPMFRFILPALPYLGLLLGGLISLVLKDNRSLFRYAVVLIIAGIFIYKQVILPTNSMQYKIYDDQKNYEIPRWTVVGQWLRNHTTSQDTVALVPIGAVGYYSERYIYDMMGLTNKYIAHKKVDLGKGWAGHEKHDGPYILSTRPTYLLLGNVMVLDFKLDINDPRFARPFNPVIKVREDDMYTDELWKNYEKKVDQIGPYYLHYFKLKK